MAAPTGLDSAMKSVRAGLSAREQFQSFRCQKQSLCRLCRVSFASSARAAVALAMRREATGILPDGSHDAHDILGVRGCRGHSISGRGINVFKPLRRNSRAIDCLLRHSRRPPYLKAFARPVASKSRHAPVRDAPEAQKGSGFASFCSHFLPCLAANRDLSTGCRPLWDGNYFLDPSSMDRARGAAGFGAASMEPDASAEAPELPVAQPDR